MLYHEGFGPSPTRKLPMRPQKQVAALPLRRIDGVIEILLVTSRDTGRWIIPKGWLSKRLKGHEAAAREAREEAGVKGKIKQRAIGSYSYIKRETSNRGPISVNVYLLAVRKEYKPWPEKDQRRRAWIGIETAAGKGQEPGLSLIIKALGRV